MTAPASHAIPARMPGTAVEVRPPAAIALHSRSEPLSPADLGELLSAFSEVTARLQATHETLRAEAARLEAELRAANEQLRRSQQLAALGEMAAGIAHEVRNPLGSIGLYASMLAADLSDRPEQQSVARKIGDAVRGLNAVVTDVLAFSREIVLRPVRTTPRELFDDALESSRHCLEGCPVGADEPPQDPVRVVRRDQSRRRQLALECDTGLLRQALVNIIRNAVDAMRDRDHGAPPPAPTITLDAEARAVRDASGGRTPMIALSVRDAGPGVPADVMSRMFNPFFTTRRTGTGLGLAIVHRIVDAHGGRVNVRNQPEGGACVELLLPDTPQRPDSQEPQA